MAHIISFPQKTEGHLSGPAICLGCGYIWQAVSPVGVIAALECPRCGLDKGVLRGLVEPEGAYFRCKCGCYLYFILVDGCQCLMCGKIASGF